MSARFDGASVVITGAASGIGAATARRFAREGAKVFLCDVNSAEDVAEAIRAEGKTAGAFTVDLALPEAGQIIVEEASRVNGNVNIVVHNAATGVAGTVETTLEEDFNRILQVNLLAGVRLSRMAIPKMRKAGGGSLLFTAGLAGHVYTPNIAAYAISKAAIIHLIHVMSLDHGRDGIRVNGVSPGPTNTPMLIQASEAFGITPAQLSAGMPTGSITEPDEIAATFAFLASNEARSITGQIIGVDGGMSAGDFPPARLN